VTAVTRLQLEALIWRNAPGLASQDTTARYAAMDAILTAADAFAVTQGGITAERRATLATVRQRRAASGAVHWLDGEELPACRPRGTSARCETVPELVTCQRCQETVSFRQAAQEARAGLVKA
jgi:hypothetical protein